MAVHKLETWFTTKLDPEWPCPACQRMSLKIIKESFNKHDTNVSQLNAGQDWFGPEEDTSVFSCLAKCTREDCGEVVACSGKGIWEEEHDYETGRTLSGYRQYLCPRFFSRPCTL